MLALSALGVLALSQAFKSRPLTRRGPHESSERGTPRTPDRADLVELLPLDLPTYPPAPVLEGLQRRAVLTPVSKRQARNRLAHTFADGLLVEWCACGNRVGPA